MVIVMAPAARGIVATDRLAPVETVVPAQDCEALPEEPLTIMATWLVPPVGSVTIELVSPPKSVNV